MKDSNKNSINKCELISDERGILLINMAFMILVLGGFFLAGTHLFEIWSRVNSKTVTNDKMSYIQNALEQYYTVNQRYPCPAPLDAPIDGTSGSTGFGFEISNVCPATGNIDGTFASTGLATDLRSDGTLRNVRTGAVPVRTLGIPDDYMFNADKQRYVYAITTDYADSGQIPLLGEEGAITIEDRGGNNATNEAGNIVHLVMSPGNDINGAYNMEGNLVSPCNATAASGENCNYNTNAVFVNSVIQSDNENTTFVNKILYKPHRSACQNTNVSNVKNVSFLIDSSTSMRSKVNHSACPIDQSILNGNKCSRMDVAHWAMRRVVSSRIYGNTTVDTPGQTSISGFKPTYDANGRRIYTVDAIKSVINDVNGDSTILFDDPTDPFYQSPDLDSILNSLETELVGTCPTVGGTPLGIHLEAFADQLGAGDINLPNKIVVISDGRSNRGKTPAQAITDIKTKYGDGIEIDIISMINNPAFELLEDPDNGIRYYESTDPDELLQSLYNSAGLCSPPPVPAITDKINC